jgi:hypothetical protein
MQLDNQTPVSALLWRTALGDDRIAAAVVARITYRVVDGQLLMDNEQPWIVSQTPWQSPAGLLPPEDCFRRGGVDLLVFGSARARDGRPTRAIEVRVRLGDFMAGVDVHGERVWVRSGSGLTPTTAVPFVELPLSLTLAYGGKQLWDQLEVAYPANPEGKGWYFDESSAVERPLPNIEDPHRPIQRVVDQADPVGVGLCPPGFGPALRRSVRFDERGILQKLYPTFFNQAFPDFIAPPGPEEGAHYAISGVHERGAIQFRIPPLPLLADVQIAGTRVERVLAVDQIGIEPDLGRVFITYRFSFRYSVVRMQPRACVLRWSPRTSSHG